MQQNRERAGNYPLTYPERMSTKEVLWLAEDDRISTAGKLVYLLETVPGALRDGMTEEDVQLSARMSWSLISWNRNGRAIVRIDEDLERMLLETDLPKSLEAAPNAPWDSFFIPVNSEFIVEHWDSGEHAVEGIFLTRDRIKISSAPDAKVADGWIILVVGVDKGGFGNDPYRKDDALHYASIVPGLPLMDAIGGYKYKGLVEAARIAINLLLLWESENCPLLRKEKSPRIPKSPKKLKRIQRQGRSTAKYWHVAIDEKTYGRTKKAMRSAEGYDGPMHKTLVRGHYNHYWVSETDTPLEKKVTEDGKIRYKVRRFIAPHWAWRRGEGKPAEGASHYKAVP